jgi:hypothetical protein
MKRIIIRGAMNHERGTEIAKLLKTTAGIQKKAWDISAGDIRTKIKPTPKTTAFTMQKISAATRNLAWLSLSMAYPPSFGKRYSAALGFGLTISQMPWKGRRSHSRASSSVMKRSERMG